MHSKTHRRNTRSGFTLMELMITLLILSILAALSLVGYKKLISQQHFKKAYLNLIAIHTRARSLHSRYGDYQLAAPDIKTLFEDMNLTTLNITMGGTVTGEDDYFDYSFVPLANTFSLSADTTSLPWGGDFELKADQNPLSATNPDCDGGCPFKTNLP